MTANETIAPEIASLPERFTNREISWLAFNDRVLAQAEDPRLPLIERLKFCAIFANNLDEFYMVRVAGLKDQVAAGIVKAPPDGLTPLMQLEEIRTIVSGHMVRLGQVFEMDLRPTLAAEGVEIVHYAELDEFDLKAATQLFDERIFAILTPLAVDPGHPFPYISNLSLNLAVIVRDEVEDETHFARIKVPPSLDRFIELPSGRYVALEEVITANLDQLFMGMEVVGAWPFRVTRNADLTLDDEEADDLLEAVEMELRRRRFGRAIRLELHDDMPDAALEVLLRELDLDPEDVFTVGGFVDSTGFFQFAGSSRPDLVQEVFPGVQHPQLANIETTAEFFRRIRERDILVHHPYISFSSSVSEFVRVAARDPKVVAIKLTLYRTSGDSPIIDALIRAAEAGKQVAALVELKARFDESANIRWARRLEEAGVHVVYGLVGLKIHCKTTLVVRQEKEGLRRYCHVGTGNYNPKTARFYEDFGLITSEPAVGDDVTALFNFLTGYGRGVGYKRLLVAPGTARTGIGELIAREKSLGPKGRIIMKMNSLVASRIIDQLYDASRAGVQIDLIVRGISCLRPGVPGLSENIRVKSIVGRYLEHSRVYWFGNGRGEGEPEILIGSADLMPRNLDRRVEALVRISSPELRDQLTHVLDANLRDELLSWILHADGSYTRRVPVTTTTGISLHDQLEAEAAASVAASTKGLRPSFGLHAGRVAQ
ncbi:MAG: polyphosphate kinase 1 [Acidimicrobiales bacterium]|nr:polyphosphate kinase 1 [Acidimicrobiales bacterium]